MSCADPLTKEKILEHLNAWIDADLAVSKSQAYSIGGRSLTKADAEVIQDKISYWRGMYRRICATGHTGISIQRFVPAG